MNLVDVLILIGITVGVAVGLFHGMLRQLFGLAILYFSTVLATAYHQMAAGWIRSVISVDLRSAQALAFVVILATFFGTLMFVTREYRNARLAILKHLDQLGGLAIGFVTACVWISLLLALVHFTTYSPWSWHQQGKPVLATFGAESVRLSIRHAIESSVLANVFTKLLPYITLSIKPWTPANVLQILSID